MPLAISLFGRLEVRRAGVPVGTTALRRRAADLLVLLALTPKHALPRDRAIEELWPERPPAVGANNLYRAVHDLRAVLGPTIVSLRHGVIALGEVEVDVDRFERDVSAGGLDRLLAAVDLYSGDLLPEDYSLEVVARRREALRAAFLDGALRAADAPAIEPGRALAVLRQAAAIDPENEEIAARLRHWERRRGASRPPLTIPATRYAKSGDVNIAYQVVGESGPDLVFVMGWVSHVEYFWTHPRVAGFFTRLARVSRLILFDKRGTGLSDRVAETPDLRQRMDDVRAVMAAVGSPQAILLGVSEGGPMCALFAATFPERTRGLVVYGGYARRAWAPDYPWAPKPEVRERFLRDIERNWGGVVDLATIAPSQLDDPSFCEWWATYLRMSASPGAALALAKMNTEIDIRAELGGIRVPTLVLHRQGDRDMQIEEGRYLARHIPGARFVELPGIDHLPWAGDPEPVLQAIEAFVREVGG
jgi:pimeloyl-ACP methyl ester carboxylesterase